MHTVSQTFILKLTPQMTRHRQRVDEFISPIANRRHFCLSWKLRHGARKILKREQSKCLPTADMLSASDAQISTTHLEEFSVSVAETNDVRKLKLSIEVSGNKTQRTFDDVFQKMVAAAQPIPGFRRVKGGKTPDIPKDILLEVLGPSKVFMEVIKEIINSTVAEYVEKARDSVTSLRTAISNPRITRKPLTMWSVAKKAVQLFRTHNKRSSFTLLHRRTFSSTATPTPTGLYGFHHLKTPKGFQSFADEAIQRCEELVSYISTKPPASELMRAMDDISDTVCSVVDSAELCRQTHPNREFVQEAIKASMRINEYLHYLNTNHELYDAAKKAEKECHMLSEEAQRGVRSLCVDMERGGIHLCPEKLDRVNMLNIEISQLCREYNENIVMDPGYVDIYPSSRVPKNLHHLVKPIYRSKSSITKDLSGSKDALKEKGFRITTDPQTIDSVLQLSSDDEIRKMVYIQGNSVPRANVDLLKRLISARHELAQIMGCRSYAELAVKPNMASSPKVVMSFLLEMSKMVRIQSEEELKLLTKFKREKCGQSDGDLRPWDETYYMTMMKSSVYKLDFSVVASYFSLSNCIEGLKILVQSLFGATFHSIPLTPGESWDPQVLKLSLHHPEEGDLGYLYLDLYSRKGKYPGCAHFAIKGGRRISQTEYQLPIVALVCNFSGSRNASAVRLNHWEVETLFHEFGHALHSLLSRTDYQHFSGTRTVLDFAEIPSNLFEYYAWDYRVLKKFARHYSTGEEIPHKLVESILGAKHMFAATDLQRQIFYALVDQTLFGEQPLPYGDSSSVVAELKREHTNLEHVEGTHWEARFSHLLNYGGGYYSYLYAKCFAATIWKKLCQEDPLSITTGFALRTKFLQHGGAREPAALLNDLAGDGIYRCHDGGIVPDISSLCEEMKRIEEYQKQVHLL